eukprot:6202153-Pleurochrysis_carterae.AAC.1
MGDLPFARRRGPCRCLGTDRQVSTLDGKHSVSATSRAAAVSRHIRSAHAASRSGRAARLLIIMLNPRTMQFGNRTVLRNQIERLDARPRTYIAPAVALLWYYGIHADTTGTVLEKGNNSDQLLVARSYRLRLGRKPLSERVGKGRRGPEGCPLGVTYPPTEGAQ